MNALAREVKISIGTHTRSGSTMINTPWHAKIEAQDLFYFIIVPIGGTLIDLAVSMKVRHRCPWNFAIWQLRWMLSQEPWENSSCGGGVPLVTTWNYRCYCFAEKRSWKTRLNESFQHILSSRSLDEQTAVENQINHIYLTSWYRHHNTALGSTSCIKRTQCHQDALWRYGFLSAYSCTLQN